VKTDKVLIMVMELNVYVTRVGQCKSKIQKLRMGRLAG
jgi:hypothetical protein